ALGSSEYIISSPVETQLYNATKLSGRTRSGLGLGLFNALSAPAYAVIGNEEDGTEREALFYPLTNHNMVVFDQNLRNNSYVSLVNSNVTRDGESYDANVTATQYEIRSKSNMFSLSGKGAFNKKFNFSDTESDEGYMWETGVSKISGNLTGGVGTTIESKYYDPNDMGFLVNPNQLTYWAYAYYNIFEPFGPFNRLWSSANVYYDNLYQPNTFTSAGMNAELGWMTKTWQAYGIQLELIPVRGWDYFDPRVDGYVFRTPISQTIGGWVSTDYRKTFALDASTFYGTSSFPGSYNWSYRISPRCRVNDHLMFIYVYSFQSDNKDIGFADLYSDDEGNSLPVMGTRDVISHTNVLTTNYAVNPNMIATCRVRHYWGFSRYYQFHGLDPWGELTATPYEGMNADGSTIADDSFNSFTIDLQYKWIFKPGSELTVVWKNAIVNFENEIPDNLLDDVNRLFDMPQSNSLSLKVLYFLDYNSLVRRG
ncbi:MAG: hypothetical protein JNM00_16110, partial [Flavobacteriales bacterium]|nr:hypothetical protein [Flavobacteriales bacterium]